MRDVTAAPVRGVASGGKMALNRNHSQEGGVVIPNAERYRGPRSRALFLAARPLLRAGAAGPGGGKFSPRRSPFPARPRGPGSAWGLRY